MKIKLHNIAFNMCEEVMSLPEKTLFRSRISNLFGSIEDLQLELNDTEILSKINFLGQVLALSILCTPKIVFDKSLCSEHYIQQICSMLIVTPSNDFDSNEILDFINKLQTTTLNNINKIISPVEQIKLDLCPSLKKTYPDRKKLLSRLIESNDKDTKTNISVVGRALKYNDLNSIISIETDTQCSYSSTNSQEDN